MMPLSLALAVAVGSGLVLVDRLGLLQAGRLAGTAGRPAAEPVQAVRSQPPPPGWREATSRALDLTLAGRDLEVLALYEEWVSRHPTFSDAHFRLGGAHEAVARAMRTSGAPGAAAARLRHYEAAAAHMRRALDLDGDAAEFLVMRSLIDLHDVIGLDRPAEYERLVREGVARFPREPGAHAFLLALLAANGEPIDAAARAARAAMPAGADARVALAGALVANVATFGRLRPSLGPALLPEASRLLDEALQVRPGDAGALRVRARIEQMDTNGRSAGVR